MAQGDLLTGLFDRAARHPRHVILSEGHDARVVAAAAEAARRKIAHLTLLGQPDVIDAELARLGASDLGIDIVPPPSAGEIDRLATLYADIRGPRLRKGEDPQSMVVRPLWQAALMVRSGVADATLGGATHTTAETVRAALTLIGSADGEAVSSFFLMIMGDQSVTPRYMIFADCALIVAPTPDQLARIGLGSAQSAARLLGMTPRIAFLSFSTLGSANHPRSRHVAEATRLAREERPDLDIIGEVQLDAAIVKSVRLVKASAMPMEEPPNILVFPNLDAGNIGYKIAERIGGATAIGPILQGLVKPANDLSRGCSEQDILSMIAITALQASDQSVVDRRTAPSR